MSDSQVVFTEVLEVTADTQKFKKSLEDLSKIWEEFTEEFSGSMTDLLGAGLNDNLKKLSDALDENVSAVKDLEKQVLESLDKIDNVNDGNVKKQRERSKKAAEEEIKALNEIAKLKAEGVEAKTVSRDEQKHRDLIMEHEGVINKYIKSEDELAEKVRGRLTEELELAESMFIAEQKRLKIIEEEEKVKQKMAAGENAAAEKQRISDERSIRMLEERERRQIRAARDINIGHEGTVNKSQEEQENKQKKFNAELEKTTDLLNKLGTAKVAGDLPKVIDNLRDRLKGVRAEMEKLTQTGVLTPKGDHVTDKDLTDLKRYNALLAEEAALLKQVASATASAGLAQRNFFDRLIGNLKGSAAHLVRFYILWNLIQGAIAGLTAIIKAPFQAIFEGIGYLRQLQNQSSELAGVLAATVKFSADFGENLRMARVAAREVTEALEDAAAATNISAETLERTLRALLTGGAGQTVRNLREMVQLAQVFQLTIQAAGVQGLAAEASIENITKLFKGTVDQSNKFLAALKLTSAEWTKIREESKTHRDLLDRLETHMKPYLDGVKAAALDQARLIRQFDLLRQRIEGLGAATLFDTLSGALKNLNDFLEENKFKIAAFVKLLADGLTLFIERISEFIGKTEIWDGFLFKLVAWRDTIMQMGAHFRYVFDVLKNDPFAESNLVGNLKEIKDSSEAIKELARGEGRTASILDQLFDFQAGTPEPEKQLANINAAFDKFYQQYLTKQEDIRESSERTRDRIRENIADHAISYRDAAKQIKEAAEEQISRMFTLDRAIDAEIQKTQKAIQADVALSPEERARALDQFEAKAEAIRRAQNKRTHNALREIVKARRDAIKEELAVSKEGFEARIRLHQQEIDQEKAIVNAAKDAGLLTEVQHFDALNEIQTDAFQTRKRLIDAEIDLHAEGTLRREQLLNDAAALEQDYTAAVELNARNRQEVTLRENLRLQEHLNNLRALGIDAADTFQRMVEGLTPEAGFTSSLNNLFTIRSADLDQLEAQIVKQLELARAKNAESKETTALVEKLKALRNERLQLFEAKLREIDSGTGDPGTRSLLIRSAVDQEGIRLRANERQARARLSQFDAVHTGLGDLTDPSVQAAREELVNAFKEAAETVNTFILEVEKNSVPSLRLGVRRLVDLMIGPGVRLAWEKATSRVDKLAAASNAAANVLASLGNIIDTFQRGRDRGGVLGGTGAVIGQFSEALTSVPVIGQFLPAISGVLQFVGSLFTGAAKRIAEDVKQSFQNTVEQFQSGNSTLVDTVRELERQRADAIIRLSGKKGGKDELEVILKEIDRELQNLRQRQQQIIEDFDRSLDVLRFQSDTLGQVHKQWIDINKTVRDYIDAGGDAAKAAEFLSLSLSKIQQQAVEELSKAEQDAIKDAVRLNDLLQQRNKIVDDFRQKEFDLINADAIERRQAGSVARGRQLEELRKQHQEALEKLDEEVRRTNIKVEKEREIFNLSRDIAELHRRDEELTLQFLDKQLQKLRELQQIAAGSMFGMNAAPSRGDINIDIHFNGPIDGSNGSQIAREISDSLSDELERRLRMVP